MPQPRGKGAVVEEVLHSFFLSFTKLASGGPQNSPRLDVVPSQNLPMLDQPHEKFNFHPTLMPPKSLPFCILSLGGQAKENKFTFLEIKGTLVVVAPSQLVIPF